MLKSMSIHQRDSKRIVKSNFVTSCLVFKGLISTVVHYLLIGGMVGLGYRDEFPMCEYTSVYGYTLDKAHGE